jgi:putative peptidoglycan lipid II flippase
VSSWFLSRSAGVSTNRKIFRAALIVGAFSIVARAGSTLKELIVAHAFGRSDALDAFLIAFLVPSFVVALVIGAMGTAFVPVFVETRQGRGDEAAQKLFSSMLFLVVIVMATLVVAIALIAPYYLAYLGSSFSVEKLRLTRDLLYVLLPLVLFNGVATFMTAVLNASEKFALPAVVPLVTPLATILFIALAVKRWGAFSLAIGVVVGSFLEAALLASALKHSGIRLKVRWNGLDSVLRRVLGQCGPLLGATFLMGGTSVVDQSMAAMLPSGSVAALNYASKIISVVLGISITALSTAVFPYFSQMVAQKDWSGCRHTLKRYSVAIVAVAMPLTIGLMVFSRPLITLLFQRGAFTSADADLVTRVQTCYAIQIPFYLWGTLFVRFLSSIKRNDILMYGAAINLALDIVLNLVLMRVWGIAGIALSTSFVYIVSFTYLVAFTIRFLGQKQVSIAPASGQEEGNQSKCVSL